MAKEIQGFKKRRGLKSELNNLPVINYFTTTYENIKSKHYVFETSLNMVESSCGMVGGRLLHLVGNPEELENRALEYLKRTKDNYPIIKKTPKGMFRKTKSRVIDWGLKKTQVVLQTSPGKVVVWGIGAASNVSDRVLSSVYYATNTQPQEPPKSKHKTDKRILKSPLKSPDKKKRRNSLRETTCTFVEFTIVLPLEVTTRFLQTIHLWLHLLLADAEEQDRQKQNLSPEKAAEIKSRRKVSPRKRIRPSTIKSWSKTAIHFLGLDRILPFFGPKCFIKDIDPSLKDCSPNKSDDGEKKRKFDDILSDDSTDDQEEQTYMDHLRKLDLSQYMSDEDPDYEPGLESTDSQEYVMGETDSDEDPSMLGITPDALPPRNKSGPAAVPSNTPSKSKPAEKTDKKSETPKNDPSKVKQKSASTEKVKPDESAKDYVQLTFKASRLDSKDVIGKSDPYLTLMKQNQEGKWQVLHKTEVIQNTLDPSWKPFSVPLLSLWNGDKNKQIKITVFDKDDVVSDDYVGEAIVTLEEVLKASKQEVTWNITNAKKQSKKKNYLNSGQVHLVSCKGECEVIREKKSNLVPLSLGLSVSATVVLALLVTHI
ncbi:uncharacterized protein LOC126828287 isoform X2 [Patella vulgata]|uniref:uncharacterized protein LOC126828287 isoform X2 n=1 Tax=Patella vulgata TaxID=6465 RepID=UPI00217F57E3|nr:uncharacterized protein LOC126828287 isoform X2 [Patella vulgata]